MFKLLFILFITINQSVIAQEQDSAVYVRRYNSSWGVIAPQIGYNYIKTKSFQKEFNMSFGSKVETIGLRMYGPINYIEENTYLDINFYLPNQYIKNDLTIYKLSGFSIGLPIFPKGLNLLGSIKQFKKFQYALPVFLGSEIGSMYLKFNDLNYHNFFYNINFQFSPRIVLFEKLVIGSSIGFNLDLTNPRWKSKANGIKEGIDYKSTSISTLLNISWIVNNRSQYYRTY